MLKRIVVSILTFVLAATTLCGCSFISHDNERDLRQKIAHVDSYEISNFVGDGYDSEVQEHKYTTKAVNIYKQDLVEYVQNNANNLSQSFGTDYKGLYKYAADMLINIELIINEVDALIDCGELEWGVKEQNAVKKQIYSVIDNTLLTTKNAILSGRGQEEIVTDGTLDSADTTYPVKPEEEVDDDDIGDNEIVYEEKPWEPDIMSYPGLYADNDTRSLEMEAMRRFIVLVESRVKDDFRVSAAEKTAIEKEIKAIDNIIDTRGVSYVYPVIGTYPVTADSEFGHIMYYLSGKTIERSQKITSLQNYLTDSVTVDDKEVADKFTVTLNDQKAKFTEDESKFDDAMGTSSTTTVLYYPNDNYFYVKHILLPFSDEQKKALTAFQTRADIVNLQEDERKAKIVEYRDRLAEAIICYPHKDGEDDMSKPMSVNDVMSHIRSVMTPLASNVKRAENAFDDLIYLYNTDPGSFDNAKGYALKYVLGEDESDTFMEEFAAAAREMRKTLAVGQFYNQKVITDYGVHVMYLASVTRKGAVDLYGYTTPGEIEKYYDIIKEPIKSARESAAYQKWENKVLSYNYEAHSKLYESRFSDLWK